MSFTSASGVRHWLRLPWQWIFEISAPGLPVWLIRVLNLVIMPSPVWAPVLFGILMKRRHGRIPPWRGLLLFFNTLTLLPLAPLWSSLQSCDGGPEALDVCFVHWLTSMGMFLLMVLWRGHTGWLFLVNIPVLLLLAGNFFRPALGVRTISWSTCRPISPPSLVLGLLGLLWLALVSLLLYRQTRRRVGG